MQLTSFTDYALRVLIYLAVRDEKCTIQELTDYYDISRNHVTKVVHKLSTLGYINSIRGKGGGITLGKSPADINIGTLIEQVEPHFHIVECFDASKRNCVLLPDCRLKHILRDAQNAFLDTLKQYNLDELTHIPPNNLQRLLSSLKEE
ncbi:MAG TPA: BadM/Rrf2 family transcriptional regulator [Myxococcales bacterium]|nr:BadM/Rrf2 family transcriptional regulator [Deltaproteobacteria bacterium]MBU50197.1 BadM/Rrf2 family transcriptional regulator [Deltaproteobacteria bacterium]HAA58321.1 BadM/Rrf2 family transcriptional regulator [Myxococcales bacterium]